VVESRPIADELRRITISRPPAGRAHPGSHLDVQVRLGERTDIRSYSIVEADRDGGELTITVMLAPQSRGGSAFMHGLEVGDTLPVTQPLQNFPLAPGAARYVLVAGGIGITAIIAMAQALKTLQADYRLVYVARSRAAMAYAEQLAEVHGDNLDLRVDDEGTPLDVGELVRSVSAGDSGRHTELYMCGPIRLMDAVRREWTAAALPPQNLRFETFGSSGWFQPEEFVVRLPELGVETTIGPNVSLLEGLTKAGVDVMYDCRKGECGLCEMQVQDVQGAIDHRDVFLSDAQKDRNTRICVCVSRVAAAGTADGTAPAVLTLSP
jgi:ferredoxin-NADP reductase